MLFPLSFNQNNHFSLRINTLSQHSLTGSFIVQAVKSEPIYHFKALVFKFDQNVYNFTFTIEWHHAHVPFFTTFLGKLTLNKEISKNTLELDWLLVEKSQQKSLSHGIYFLCDQPSVQHNRITSHKLPFPLNPYNNEQNTSKGYVLTTYNS
ncbi:hypothetical protein LVD15_15080 [Fulvivirga maritima]|uniref:hypothetical protein n=1 Tax=Fulvivirga maritima TaxID=2904247 RepID=UPI001F28673C|nr:hypothetical protein [Fulvivirga maritima]UII24643.1 hypothetical protein LVD15_15080 [Fulvivirga maritima]